MSPKQRAYLRHQGKYMGTMPGLKPRQRAMVKAIRAAKEIKVAIRAAEEMGA